MFYGHAMFTGSNSQEGYQDIYLLQFITVVSGGYKTDFNLNNIIATLSFYFFGKNSWANPI